MYAHLSNQQGISFRRTVAMYGLRNARFPLHYPPIDSFLKLSMVMIEMKNLILLYLSFPWGPFLMPPFTKN